MGPIRTGNSGTVLILLFIALLMNCATGIRDTDDESSMIKDSTVVFFDIGNYSRKELSQFIDLINKFEPGIIALSLQFDSLKKREDDSLLIRSIENAGKVILSAEIGNDDSSIRKSHQAFSKYAMAEGVLSYLVGKDGLTDEYIPLFEDSQGQMLSFPEEIVFNFEPSTLKSFDRLRVNKTVRINYVKGFGDFFILDEKELEPKLIKGKIVVFGYLGVDGFVYSIPSANGGRVKAPSALVTANIILNRLSDPN